MIHGIIQNKSDLRTSSTMFTNCIHHSLTVDPAGTVAVVVVAPLVPLTLHRMSSDVTFVTGELLGTGRMLTNASPVALFAISLLKISTGRCSMMRQASRDDTYNGRAHYWPTRQSKGWSKVAFCRSNLWIDGYDSKGLEQRTLCMTAEEKIRTRRRFIVAKRHLFGASAPRSADS